MDTNRGFAIADTIAKFLEDEAAPEMKLPQKGSAA